MLPKLPRSGNILLDFITIAPFSADAFGRAALWFLLLETLSFSLVSAKPDSPARALADAHRRRFDAVIVWKFDRFARSVSHLLRALETFQTLGIHFISLSESLDTSTPAGKMVFTVLGAVAELSAA
jgi:hypothetical protein